MSIKPLGQPEAVSMTFEFVVSGDWIEEELASTGVLMPETWSAEFSLPDLEPSVRKQLIRAHRLYMEAPGLPEVYAPVDDAEQFILAINGWVTEAREAREREEHESSLLKAAEATQAERFELEKETWIAEQGSDRLKTAAERGYKINRSYAVERAVAEFPRFWVDTSGEAEIRERTDPSEEALRVEDAVTAWISMRDHHWLLQPRVSWMVSAPREMEESTPDFIDQQEVIVVTGFLGRYSLILPLDPDLQRALAEEAD